MRDGLSGSGLVRDAALRGGLPNPRAERVALRLTLVVVPPPPSPSSNPTFGSLRLAKFGSDPGTASLCFLFFSWIFKFIAIKRCVCFQALALKA